MLKILLRQVSVLGLMVASGVWARPGPETARTLSARRVVVGEEPVEVRVHPDFPTLLSFESEVVAGSLGVEEPERVRLLETEGRGVVLLEPLRELAEGERVRLWLSYARGGTVKRATLVLVPHASEVDVQVRVVLPGKLARPEPRASRTMMKLLLTGEVVPGRPFSGNQVHATLFSEGVEAKELWGYQLDGQWVSALLVRNPEGAAPWEPRVVRLTSSRLGAEPVALPARMHAPRLMPGESGWVLMEWPLEKETDDFHLEVRERESGRGVRVEREGR